MNTVAKVKENAKTIISGHSRVLRMAHNRIAFLTAHLVALLMVHLAGHLMDLMDFLSIFPGQEFFPSVMLL